MHVLGVDFRTRIQEQLDGFFVAEGGGTVEWSLGFRSAVAHEAIGFNAFPGRAIWIRPAGEQHSDDVVVGRTIGFAQGRVQWRFSGIWQRPIYIGAVFDEELAEPPVPMKRRAIEVEVASQRLERLALGKEKPDTT